MSETIEAPQGALTAFFQLGLLPGDRPRTYADFPVAEVFCNGDRFLVAVEHPSADESMDVYFQFVSERWIACDGVEIYTLARDEYYGPSDETFRGECIEVGEENCNNVPRLVCAYHAAVAFHKHWDLAREAAYRDHMALNGWVPKTAEQWALEEPTYDFMNPPEPVVWVPEVSNAGAEQDIPF